MILNGGEEISQHSFMETEYSSVTKLHTTGIPVDVCQRTGKGLVEHWHMRFRGFTAVKILTVVFWPVKSRSFTSTQKMETICSAEMLVTTYQIHGVET
jgi:hypothetical protein